MLSLEALFCHVDDFCHWFEPRWQPQLLSNGLQRRQRVRSLCLSEMMTIVIAFHQSAYRNFKAFYKQLVCRYWRNAFPALVSYNRFTLMDAFTAATVVCLFTSLFRQGDRHQLHRLHKYQGLP